MRVVYAATSRQNSTYDRGSSNAGALLRRCPSALQHRDRAAPHACTGAARVLGSCTAHIAGTARMEGGPPTPTGRAVAADCLAPPGGPSLPPPTHPNPGTPCLARCHAAGRMQRAAPRRVPTPRLCHAAHTQTKGLQRCWRAPACAQPAGAANFGCKQKEHGTRLTGRARRHRGDKVSACARDLKCGLN